MDIQKLFSTRLGGERFGTENKVYKFRKIKDAKAQALKDRPDMELFDFGVGEPDLLSPQALRDAMADTVHKPENRGYADNGLEAFKEKAAEHMRLFYGVDVDPATEINHSIGSKPALAMLPLAFINPGDVTIQTVPGYPVMATHTGYLGGEVYEAPLTAANGYFPDLNAIPEDICKRAKLFYINYPNNPTGAAATEAFYDEIIAFADRHNILIIQDAPYAALVYDRPRLSIMSRPGAKEVALEIHSMSKAFNMTGWRLAFVVGQERLVKAFSSIKDNIDSGQFKAIQEAACHVVTDVAFVDDLTARYQRRLTKMVAALNKAGFKASLPGGTFYLYVDAPTGAGDISFANAEEASQYLIKEYSVSTVPWDEVEPALRFSATFESNGEDDDERVLSELGERLKQANLRFSDGV